MISISIDLRKIDQSRCKRMTLKSGESATFCELVLFETPGGQYGDYAVKQSMTKEERESGKKMPFIGNGKNLGGGKPTQGKPYDPPRPPSPRTTDEDGVPF